MVRFLMASIAAIGLWLRNDFRPGQEGGLSTQHPRSLAVCRPLERKMTYRTPPSAQDSTDSPPACLRLDRCAGVTRIPAFAYPRNLSRRHRREISRIFAAWVRLPSQQASVSMICFLTASASVASFSMNITLPSSSHAMWYQET